MRLTGLGLEAFGTLLRLQRFFVFHMGNGTVYGVVAHVTELPGNIHEARGTLQTQRRVSFV